MQEKLLLREQWVRYREQERAQIRLGGPITGLVFGVAILSASTWLLTKGERTTRMGGTIGLLVSVPMTSLSAVMLTKRVKKRRAIAREIWGPTATR